MSNPPPQTPRPEKSMSSRLMTMKFMQRAAASSPSSNSQTPDIPSAKRQKLSSANESTPTPPSDLQAIQNAMKAEEDKISQAVDRLAAEAGETKWSLSYSDRGKRGKETRGLHVVTVGYSYIDASGTKDTGRMKFGDLNRTLHEQRNSVPDQSSSSSKKASEAEGETYNDDDDDLAEANELIRASREEVNLHPKAELKAEKRAKKVNVGRLAKKRKSKGVKLNSLTSISGGKSSNGKGGGGNGGGISEVLCYHCGQIGHRKAECRKRKIGLDYRVTPKKPKVSLDY